MQQLELISRELNIKKTILIKYMVTLKNQLLNYRQLIEDLIKWSALATAIGAITGVASAFFLDWLHLVTEIRESNIWIIWLLPIGGLIIGLMYHYYGESVVKGNNQLIDEFHKPKKIIPFRMAPMVLLGTLITHLFGGSVGREGTAVQIGGAIADRFTKWFKLNSSDRTVILAIGVSTGFASVFGTPLAGAVFALEVFTIGRSCYKAILPSFIGAAVSDIVCRLIHDSHTVYSITDIPQINLENLTYSVAAGILFGLAAMLFSNGVHIWSNLFKSKIKYPPLRPVIGGAIIALSVFAMGTTKYIGLGVPTIVESFTTNMNWYDFLIKIALTTFTIGAGFKGGEVTPLFYTGATLGSALALIIPLPTSLLAGMGFVALFSGATNTPIACILMGIELFGSEGGVYIAIACVTAYIFSGKSGIYSSQRVV